MCVPLPTQILSTMSATKLNVLHLHFRYESVPSVSGLSCTQTCLRIPRSTDPRPPLAGCLVPGLSAYHVDPPPPVFLLVSCSDMCRFGIESLIFPNLTASLSGVYEGFYTQARPLRSLVM